MAAKDLKFTVHQITHPFHTHYSRVLLRLLNPKIFITAVRRQQPSIWLRSSFIILSYL